MKNITTFKSDKRCKVCSGILPDGRELRPEIEQMRGEGVTYDHMIQWAADQQINLSQQNLVRHFKMHAKYVEKGVILSPEQKKVITTFTHSSESSKRIISKILGRSEEMLDNWWKKVNGEEIYGPTMPITEKLLIGTMAEETRRAPKTAIDTDIENLSRQAIEGEVTEDTPDGSGADAS